MVLETAHIREVIRRASLKDLLRLTARGGIGDAASPMGGTRYRNTCRIRADAGAT
jgi:hypothetical protein